MNKEKKAEVLDLKKLSSLELGPNWEKSYKVESIREKNFKKKKNNKHSNCKLSNKRERVFGKYNIEINYDRAVIEKIRKQIRISKIAYSIQEITNTLIEKKERLSFKIQSESNDNFYLTSFDSKIYSSSVKATDYIKGKGLSEIIEYKIIEEEKPKGKYKNILKCSSSNSLFPPINFHNFKECINFHLIMNNINKNFNSFVESLQVETDEKIIEEWKQTPQIKREYNFKNINLSEKTFMNIESIISYIEKNEKKFIKKVKMINISGTQLKKLDDDIYNSVKRMYLNNVKWKKNIFFNVLINFKKSNFSVFKHKENKKYYVSSIKLKEIKNINLTKVCALIIKYVNKNCMDKKDLLKELNSQGVDKIIILGELKWLINEGYASEFNDGTIVINQTK